jgi:peroxiredoxin
MKYIALAIVLVLVVSAAGFRLFFHAKAAPEVSFITLKGETFWATDCRACLQEIPHWQALYQTYHQRGLEMIAISMFYDPPSRVVRMVEDKAIGYPVTLDFTAELSKAFGQVELTPTTFVINADGDIVKQTVGAVVPNAIQQLIEQLLTE